MFVLKLIDKSLEYKFKPNEFSKILKSSVILLSSLSDLR